MSTRIGPKPPPEPKSTATGKPKPVVKHDAGTSPMPSASERTGYRKAPPRSAPPKGRPLPAIARSVASVSALSLSNYQKPLIITDRFGERRKILMYTEASNDRANSSQPVGVLDGLVKRWNDQVKDETQRLVKVEVLGCASYMTPVDRKAFHAQNK